MSNFSIPQSMNPVRYQASLGGNVKSTNIDNVHEQFQIELGIVKKVFYRKGTLLFSIINRGSSVSVVGNDTSSATASAPIPVETFGRNSDGKIFGGYRPVKVGSKIAVGYVNGERSAPIVLGVYPDNDESYEIVSPVSFETGEDSDKSVEDIALGSKEITASQNIIYQSGKGDILKTFNGKSLLYINANGSNYMDDINYAYDQIADTRDGNMNPVTPRETRAQSWLLVHEDNPENEETNGHRTRFYVNKNGEFQMVMFSPNNDSDNNLVVFTASKDDGFKLRKQFDTDDLDGSDQYVQFSIGSGNSAVLQSVDKEDASEISVLPNGLQLTTPNNGTMTFNGHSLENMFGSISSAVDVAKAAGDKADNAASAGAIAQSAASDAASQAALASQAGEDAKHAAVDAQAAGEDAKAQAQDTRDRIIYYSSISNEKDVAIPGKYIIVNTDTYIKNGTIKTAHIGDGAITNAKIANLAVGTAQLEDAAITRAKIGNLAVGTAQIEDAAITDAKVGNLSANHLNAGTIDFSVISGIHINASEIDVGKIVADQIYVNGLGDISKNLGTVTSGKITGTNINSDVDNLNDPNLMNVIEKQTVISQYAGLTSQYNVILARAKDASISTTDLTTAYTNLNNFMAIILTDTTKASGIDRDTYMRLTYDYNAALSNVQTALEDSFNADIDNMHSSVLVASQAASNAVIVASQAAITGDTANQVASRAIVVANDAQSAGNNAISVANNASQAASGAVIAGSTASVNADKAVKVASQAQIAGNNATSVANNASQAASGAILAGSTATVIANKASTVANEAKSAGDNATSVANNATSVANSAKSTADSTYAYANSEIAVQSTATTKAQSTADNAFSQAQAVGSQASAEIAVQSTATAKAQSTADNAFSQAQAVGSQASAEIAVQSTATAKAQSTADNAFSQAQAVGSQASADISRNSTATAKAQSTADNAFSKAQSVGSQASAEINSNSTATAKAQSTADNAFSQATTAIDNGKVTSQAVTDLKDGSKLTIAELENGLATKVANSDYASYKEQTASQIGQLVTNGAFSAYQTQTADLIAQKVATSDFSAYQATTAKAIESKVESKDFNTYKTQTADLIDDKVSNSAYASDKTQTASEIADRVSNSAFSTYQTQTASQIASKVDNGDFSTYKTQTAKLIAQKVANSDFSAYQATTAKAISSKVESSDFNTYKTQTADMISSKVESKNFQTLQTQVDNSAVGTNLAPGTSSDWQKVSTGGWGVKNLCDPTYEIVDGETYTVQVEVQNATSPIMMELHCFTADGTRHGLLGPSNSTVKDGKISTTFTAHLPEGYAYFAPNLAFVTPLDSEGSYEFRRFKIEKGSLATDWTPAPEDLATQSQITQLSGEIADRVSNSAFSTYQTQTASQIASKVDNGDFSTYKTQTADLISSKVANKDFTAYQATTAKSIESKVESSDFNTYKTQTADLINDKVSNSEYASDKTQTASQISQMVSNSAFSAYQTQTASQIAQTVSNSAFSAYQQTTADLISSKVATKDFSAYQATTAKSIESKVESSDFNTYKTQTADLIDDKVSNSAYASDKTQTASEIADRVSNSAFSTYQTQTASQIASKVDNGDFSTYKTQTADLIAQKVANSDFSSYKDQTATAINSKVDNGDFNTYKKQTANMLQTLVGRSPSNIIKDGGFNSAVVGQIPNFWDFSGTAQIAVNSDKASDLVATGRSVLQINSKTSGNSDIYYGDWFDVQHGDQFYAELKARWESMSQKGTIRLGVVTKDATGHWTWTGAVNISSPSNWAKYTGVLTIPSGAVQGRVWVSWQWPAVANEAVFVTDLVVRPAYSTQSDITQAIDNIHLGFKNPDGSSFQMNLSADGTAFLDFSKIILNGSTNITNGTIGTAQIANMAVGTAQIANGAITNAQIGSLAVDTANIKDAAISSAKIANLAVGTAQIGDGAITNAKIGKLAVGTAQIANGAITDAQIGSLAVGTAQIKDEAVNSAKIAKLAVGTAQIGDGAITNAKIGKLAVGTAQIANAAITDAQIGDVSADKLTAGTIDFNTITGKNINASNINTGKLNTERLNVDKLSAVSGDLGDITTGTLKGVNIVAKTFSTPNGSFTTDENGAITAKSMALTDGKVSSSTISASTINGSTINGATFHGGSVINNSNNTAGYYPISIDSLGTYNSTYIDNGVALRSSIQSGAILYNYRSMSANSGHYNYSNTVINGQGLTVDSGYTTVKDTTFSASQTETAYVSISTNGGLFLHGSDANIDFGGHLSDNETNVGMYMNPYGNIIGKSWSDYWQVSKQGADNTGGGATARFGIDTGGKGTINFYRPLFVDEIGGFTSNNGHALFIHGDDSDSKNKTGQMLFRQDGSGPQVVSASIYNRTYSSGSTVTVTGYGTLGRITSASKYKLDITKETSLSPANKLLSIDRSSWVDKNSAERLANSKTNGTEPSEPEINVFRHYGLIAEDLIKAGLDEFVIKGKDGQAEGIEYDRLWTVLIPKIRDLSNQQINDRMTINRLEKEIEKLKQEVLSK